MIKLNQDKGYALAFTLVFLFLIVSFVSAYILMTSQGLATASRSADTKRAYYMSDAGLADAFIQLRNYAAPPALFSVNKTTYALGNGKTGAYLVSAVKSGGVWSTYTITSRGIYKGITKTLVLSVQQTSISSYAYLSNTEVNPNLGTLWWATGAVTVGPVRTNGYFNIWGDPVFNGTTMQSSAWKPESAIRWKSWNAVTKTHPNDNPVFSNGITLGAPTVPFPTATLLNSISTGATASGLLLTGASTIVFNADGTLNVTNTAKNWNNKNVPAPVNGMIYVKNSNNATDGNATIKGTIKGQLTVASANQVLINGSLVYNTDPRTNPASTDLLGVVSNKDITVVTASAPADLELDAVLVALTGAFQLDNAAHSFKTASHPARAGDMVQYGSLVNNYCGATNAANTAGDIVGGYLQLQSYDSRLQTIIPPGFLPAVDSTGRTIYVKLSFKEQ